MNRYRKSFESLDPKNFLSIFNPKNCTKLSLKYELDPGPRENLITGSLIRNPNTVYSTASRLKTPYWLSQQLRPSIPCWNYRRKLGLGCWTTLLGRFLPAETIVGNLESYENYIPTTTPPPGIELMEGKCSKEWQTRSSLYFDEEIKHLPISPSSFFRLASYQKENQRGVQDKPSLNFSFFSGCW